MTDLQLISLILGAAIVIVVYAYNWWQEYRYRKQASRAFVQNQPDVLLETPRNLVRTGESQQRLEPMLDPARADEESEIVPTLRATEPIRAGIPPVVATAPMSEQAPVVEHFSATAPPRPAARPAPDALARDIPQEASANDSDMLAASLFDPALDFIAEVHFSEGVLARDVPPFPAGKRVQVIGRGKGKHWEVVQSSSSNIYTELRIALQLADRQGALTPEHLNAFCMAVQQFSDDFEGVAVMPQRSGKLSLAQQLDEFCASVDVLIGLNILPQSTDGFALEKLRQLAEGEGLMRGSDGNFHYLSESGKTLFSLANIDGTAFANRSTGVTVLFDVPRVAGGVAVFDFLAEFAQNLAASLGGRLVDDNGKALSETSLGNIRKQLAGIYAKMDDRGIAAGSVAALRLFA